MRAALRRRQPLPQSLHMRAAQEDPRRTAGGHGIGEPCVVGIRTLAQLAHVAQRQHPAPLHPGGEIPGQGPAQAFAPQLDAGDPAILGALQPARAIIAMVAAQGRIASFPLWQASGQ